MSNKQKILYNRPELKEKRRALRNNPTQAEKHLWRYLKNSQVANTKFRRQQSIGPFIVDFFCYKNKLVIELDGQHHFEEENILYDKERTAFLENYGIKVIRFENQEVLYDTDRVLREIEAILK